MARKTFKKILDLCFGEEDYIELHSELISLEVEVKRKRDYRWGVDQAYAAIPLYTDDFPEETMEEIELLYEDYIYSLEN